MSARTRRPAAPATSGPRTRNATTTAGSSHASIRSERRHSGLRSRPSLLPRRRHVFVGVVITFTSLADPAAPLRPTPHWIVPRAAVHPPYPGQAEPELLWLGSPATRGPAGTCCRTSSSSTTPAGAGSRRRSAPGSASTPAPGGTATRSTAPTLTGSGRVTDGPRRAQPDGACPARRRLLPAAPAPFYRPPPRAPPRRSGAAPAAGAGARRPAERAGPGGPPLRRGVDDERAAAA